MRTMRVFLLGVFLTAAAFMLTAGLPMVDDYDYTGTVNFDSGCRWLIDGTRVTATAADLNQIVIGGALPAMASGTFGTLTSQTNLSAAVASASTRFTALSRFALLSKDTNTQFAFESGTATGTQVITYTTAFSANPIVLLSLASAGGTNDTANLFAVQTSPRTNFTTTILGTVSFNWMAIGTK